MKKIFLLLTLLSVVNIFCEAQSGLDVIMVSPTQYNAILKRDSIIQANKAKPKVFKTPVYQGSKDFLNITIPTVSKQENKQVIKPNYYPFYKPTNYQHVSNSFDLPLIQSPRIVVDVNKAARIDSMKNAKSIQMESLKNAKKIELQAKADHLQELKNDKSIKLEKLKNVKKIEQQKKDAKLKKQQNNKAKINKKLKNKQEKNKNKIKKKNEKRKKISTKKKR